MSILNIILPIFLQIFIGWAAVKNELIPRNLAENLVYFVFWIAAPSIIFNAISNYHMTQLLEFHLWFAYILIIMFMGSLVFLIFRKYFEGSIIKSTTIAFSVIFKNTVMIGFPILMSVIGNDAIFAMTISVILFNCIIAPIFIFIYELYLAPTKNIYQSVKGVLGVLRNPLVFASLLGVIFAKFQLPVPIIIKNILISFAGSFVPCALFSIGVSLGTFKISDVVFETIFIILASLIASPLFAIGLSCVMHLKPSEAIALVIFSGAPTAQSFYIYVSKYKKFERDVAAIISITTLISMVTLPLVIFMCYELWPSAFIFMN